MKHHAIVEKLSALETDAHDVSLGVKARDVVVSLEKIHDAGVLETARLVAAGILGEFLSRFGSQLLILGRHEKRGGVLKDSGSHGDIPFPKRFASHNYDLADRQIDARGFEKIVIAILALRPIDRQIRCHRNNRHKHRSLAPLLLALRSTVRLWWPIGSRSHSSMGIPSWKH